MKSFKFILMFIFLLLPLNIKAMDYEEYCGYENIANLKKVANNINIKYDVIEKNNNVTFDITISNIHEELLVVDDSTGKEYTYNEDNKGEIKIGGYKSGQSISYTIYFKYKMCLEEVLSIKYVTLPHYNPYYNNRVCDDLEDYSLCQKWINHGLTETEFVKRVSKYKESLIVEEDPIVDNDIKGIVDYIIEFFLISYMYILPIIIIGGIILIIYLYRKDSFEFLK